MRYRNRPVEIEAFQMTLERRWDRSEWPTWLHIAWTADYGRGSMSSNYTCKWAEGHKSPAELVLETPKGTVNIDWDDWIIKDKRGDLTTCMPDLFELTYEEVA